MKKLTIDLLKKEFKNFRFEQNSYINTYPEFIKYFDNIKLIDKHNLIVSSHFVYGWMPTIISLNLNNLSEVLKILNKVKKGDILKPNELNVLKIAVNNSLVGVSKLLHFIRPDIYPIWDSKIYKHITGNKSTYGIGKPERYLLYLNEIQILVKSNEFQKIYLQLKTYYNYDITKIRAVDLLLFQSKN